MPDGYILGLDAGTSVVKAAIFDLQGNELSRGARSVPISNPEPHLAEEDMQEVWVAATEAISHALVNSSVRADQILGISATGQGDGSWLIDRDGKPRGPAILWTDGRAGEIVDTWNTDGSITRLAGSTIFTISKLTNERGGRQTQGTLSVGETWNRAAKVSETGSFEVKAGGTTAAVEGTAFVAKCVPTTDGSKTVDCTFTAVVDDIKVDSDLWDVTSVTDTP